MPLETPWNPHRITPAQRASALNEAAEVVDKFLNDSLGDSSASAVDPIQGDDVEEQKKDLASLRERIASTLFKIELLSRSVESAQSDYYGLALELQVRQEILEATLNEKPHRRVQLPDDVVGRICAFYYATPVATKQIPKEREIWGHFLYRNADFAVDLDNFNNDSLAPARHFALYVDCERLESGQALLKAALDVDRQYGSVVIKQNSASSSTFWAVMEMCRGIVQSTTSHTVHHNTWSSLSSEDQALFTKEPWEAGANPARAKVADFNLHLAPRLGNCTQNLVKLNVRLPDAFEGDSGGISSFFPVPIPTLSSLSLQIPHVADADFLLSLFKDPAHLEFPYLSRLQLSMVNLNGKVLLAILKNLKCAALKVMVLEDAVTHHVDTDSSDSDDDPDLLEESLEEIIDTLHKRYKTLQHLSFKFGSLNRIRKSRGDISADKEAQTLSDKILEAIMPSDLDEDDAEDWDAVLPNLNHLAIPFYANGLRIWMRVLSDREFVENPIRTLEITDCPPPSLTSKELGLEFERLRQYAANLVITTREEEKAIKKEPGGGESSSPSSDSSDSDSSSSVSVDSDSDSDSD